MNSAKDLKPLKGEIIMSLNGLNIGDHIKIKEDMVWHYERLYQKEIESLEGTIVSINPYMNYPLEVQLKSGRIQMLPYDIERI